MDKIVHFEIPAENMGRAKKFYSEIFGWGISDMPDMDYVVLDTVAKDENGVPKEVGGINGGMVKISATAKNPILVINVTDITSYLLRVEKYGGVIVMPPHQIGNMGMYSRFADCEGNIMGLWQSFEMKPVEKENVLKLGCNELGGECDFVAEGKSAEEVKDKIFEHAKLVHPEKIISMSEEEKVMMNKVMDQLLEEQRNNKI